MKKIVLASAAMGGAALVAFGASGTFAAFSDEASVANEAAAGTLYLTTDKAAVSTGETGVSALAPGDTATYTFYVENAGDMPGTLVATFQLLSNRENGCTPAELRGDNGIDDSCTEAEGQGELVDAASVTTIFGLVSNRAACTSTAPLQPHTPTPATLAGLDDDYTTQVIGAKKGFCAVVTVALPEDADNTVQSDSASFAIDYTLDQITS